MKALDLFFPYVMPYAPGVTDPLALQAIRFAAIDFCMQTDLIQRVSMPDVVAGTSAYTITVPANMTLERVLKVFWKDRELLPSNPDSTHSAVAIRGASIDDATPRTGDPQVYFQADPSSDTFNLYPIPDTSITAGLTIRASFSPAQNALTVDDPLFDDWAEDIAAGAIGRLLMMPNQLFTNTSASSLYNSSFLRAISQARRQKQLGRTAGSQRVAPRPFA